MKVTRSPCRNFAVGMPQIYRPQCLTMSCKHLLLASLLTTTALRAQTDGTCMPVGGKSALDRLFEQELVYPAVALEAGIKGEVVVTVKVDPNGKLNALSVGRSLSPECDAEALRVVGHVLWQPATAGETCATKEHYLAVPFDPARYKRWVKARHLRSGEVFALPADSLKEVRSARELEKQVEPDIPNGLAGLPAFLGRELRYPNEAFRYSLEGTVQLEFVVEPSGTISNMRAVKEVGGGCTEEAMRLMHRIAWKPGVMGGKRVRSTQQVSIRFNLPQEAR